MSGPAIAIAEMEFFTNTTDLSNITSEVNGTLVLGHQHIARFLAYTVISPIIIIVGLMGNTLSLVVLLQDKVTPTSFLLIALGVADNLYLISFAILIYTNMTMQLWRGGDIPVENVLSITLESLTRATSMWLTVMVAVTRYIAVVHQFYARNYITFTRVIVATAILMIFFILFHFPYYAYISAKLFDLDHGYSSNQTLFAKMETHDLRFKRSYDIFKEIVVFIIPIILLVYFSASLIHAYQRVKVTITKMSASQFKDEGQVTLMTIVMVMVVILCQVLWLVSVILGRFVGSTTHTRLVRTISCLPKAINSAVNFLIYSLCRKHFRQSLQALWYSCSLSMIVPRSCILQTYID